MEYVTLNNGIKMPILGYGVYQTPEDVTESCCLKAIKIGYRLIDTAQAYNNEEGVGNAIKNCGLPREELFITSKIWVSNGGYDHALASLKGSLKKLKSDYVDLMLIHQPYNDYYGTYRALEDALDQGLVRAIGVSNFYADRYLDLKEFSRIIPAVNQMETHVFNQQKELRDYLNTGNTKLMAWGPFAEGRNDFFNNETLMEIGKAHHKSPAQTALRFLIQNGIIAIPKSVHEERMRENFEIFDFKLNDEEMKRIEALDTATTSFFSHRDPKFISWLFEKYPVHK